MLAGQVPRVLLAEHELVVAQYPQPVLAFKQDEHVL
jgi:hypothetical protein